MGGPRESPTTVATVATVVAIISGLVATLGAVVA
jgi:hypothetical protein